MAKEEPPGSRESKLTSNYYLAELHKLLGGKPPCLLLIRYTEHEIGFASKEERTQLYFSRLLAEPRLSDLSMFFFPAEKYIHLALRDQKLRFGEKHDGAPHIGFENFYNGYGQTIDREREPEIFRRGTSNRQYCLEFVAGDEAIRTDLEQYDGTLSYDGLLKSLDSDIPWKAEYRTPKERATNGIFKIFQPRT